MKKIASIVQPLKLDEVFRGRDYEVEFLPKMNLEMEEAN